MPTKKIDPLIRCMDYFQDAELSAATTALTVAENIVKRRLAAERGEAPTPTRKKRRSTTTTVTPITEA